MKEFAIKYTEEFTEDIFNALINWCSKNITPLKWYSYFDDTFDLFKQKKWFRYVYFDVGVDNNSQGAPEKTLQELCDMIGYTKELSKDELLEKAKRDYPVGTKIKLPEGLIGKDYYTVSNNNFTWGSNDNIAVSTKEGDFDSVVERGAAVYFKGNWAAIESTPQEKWLDTLNRTGWITADIEYNESIVWQTQSRKENTSDLIDINFDIPIVIGE